MSRCSVPEGQVSDAQTVTVAPYRSKGWAKTLFFYRCPKCGKTPGGYHTHAGAHGAGKAHLARCSGEDAK